MYTQERAEWWAGRSNSKGHQEAYDTIAALVPSIPQGVYMDVACGSGNILTRLQSRGSYRLLIGTDSLDAMLLQTKDRLTKLGARVSLNGHGNLPDRGIVLIKDNILDSRLSQEIADVVLFSFPEIGKSYPNDDLNKKLSSDFKAAFPMFPDEEIELKIPTLRAQKALAGYTKQDGRVIVSQYGYTVLGGEVDAITVDYLKKSWAMFGMDLVESTFFDSFDVWLDTNPKQPKRFFDRRGLVCGYRVTTFKKR